MIAVTASLPFRPSTRRAIRSGVSKMAVVNVVLIALAVLLLATYIFSYIVAYRAVTSRDKATSLSAEAATEVRQNEAEVASAMRSLDKEKAASFGLVEVVPRYVSVNPEPSVVGVNVR